MSGIRNILGNSVLVVSPHLDDEILGCGGSILRMLKEGIKVDVLCLTKKTRNRKINVYDDHNLKQFAEKIKVYSKINNYYFGDLPDSRFTLEDAIDVIENVLNHDSIIGPSNISTNQDHRRAYEAIVSVSRLFRDKKFKSIILYEDLYSGIFYIDSFCPELFIEIDIKNKKKLLSYYFSELVGKLRNNLIKFGKNIFSLVDSVARLRGIQCGVDYGEAFKIYRLRL